MKKASREEIWQASRYSYGFMRKTLSCGERHVTTLYPPLKPTGLLKELGMFKIADLQFATEDKEANKVLATMSKK